MRIETIKYWEAYLKRGDKKKLAEMIGCRTVTISKFFAGKPTQIPVSGYLEALGQKRKEEAERVVKDSLKKLNQKMEIMELIEFLIGMILVNLIGFFWECILAGKVLKKNN